MNRYRTGAIFATLFAAVYIALHYLPYLSPLRILSDDYMNVAPVLWKFWSPDLFPGNLHMDYLYHKQTGVSWLYFYGYLFPLSGIINPISLLKMTGYSMLVLLFILAGQGFTSETDFYRASIVTVVFLHLAPSVNPYPGLARSFSVLAFMALLWSERRGQKVPPIVLVAFTAGVYPPAALVMLVYVWFKLFETCYSGEVGAEDFWPPIATLLLFLVMLTPYFTGMANPQFASADTWVQPLEYNLYSLQGFWDTIVIGSGRTAFMRAKLTYVTFVVFGGLVLLQLLVLRGQFQWFRECKLLLLSGLFTWLCAHLLHPMIYHPFKYTRVVLPLIVVYLFCENYLSFFGRIRSWLGDLEWVGYGLLIPGLLLGISYMGWLVVIGPSMFIQYMRNPGTVFWGLFLGSILMIAFLITPIEEWEGVHWERWVPLALLVVWGFYPHCFTSCVVYYEDYFSVSNYRGMYKRLKQTPRKTVVAGPPGTMDTIPAYARRGVYFNHEQHKIKALCERIRTFKKIYYSSSGEEILSYLERTGVDYLVVNRLYYQPRFRLFGCGKRVRREGESVLNQQFSESEWEKRGIIYLLSRDDLRSAFRQ
ncbi:MAG: hypothetical protein ABEK50_09830 [bacterium]